MTMRWIWLVPSTIWVTLESRYSYSAMYSFNTPYQPRICTASVAFFW